MKNISLNPIYTLKPDIGKSFLVTKESMRKNDIVKNGSEFVLHPVHAAILNLVNGDDYKITVERIASCLSVEEKIVENFINTLLDNKQYVKFHNKKLPSFYCLPPMTIISSDFKRDEIYHQSTLLRGKVDVRYTRHETPTTIILMLNNKCVTDCFYCYADKRNPVDCSVSLERLQQIIEEARNINIKNFDVIGGEFFLYSHWKELMKILRDNNYEPYISTKVPLGENEIQFLAEFKIKDLQISLDTMIKEHLCGILHVNAEYFNRMQKMFQLLDKYNIKLFIHTILNSKNESIEDMQSVFEFINQYNNIQAWQVDIAGPSLYKMAPYDSIKPNAERVNNIMNYLNEIEDKVGFKIVYPRTLSYEVTENDKAKAFSKRLVCSGNYSSCFILPDGNVTICEQLYWNERFIIGNIKEQSLLDVWNSKKALDLYYLAQNEIPKDSKCSSCSIYTQCRQGKGVCWKSIIQKFGKDKWYYPDPLCPE